VKLPDSNKPVSGITGAVHTYTSTLTPTTFLLLTTPRVGMPYGVFKPMLRSPARPRMS
jgi:hypothetical protein